MDHVSERVRNALCLDATLANEANRIRVTGRGGEVTLAGMVSSLAATERAATVAGRVRGVVRVENQLTVRNR